MINEEFEKTILKVFSKEKIDNDIMKALINQSVIKNFGIIVANKIKYSLEQNKSTKEFIVTTYKKHYKKLFSAITLITDEENQLRVKLSKSA